MPGLPDNMPVLSRGRHLDPAEGGCLMEVASVLAGERWSDSPRCTHPVLAAVARLVNDASSDQARPHLAELVADLVGAVGDRRTAPELVIHCAGVALRYGPEELRPRRAIDRAARRIAGVRTVRFAVVPGARQVNDWIYTYGPATRTVARTLDMIARNAPDPDAAMAELLRDCLAATLRRCPPSPRSSSAWTSSTRPAGPSRGTRSGSSAAIRAR